MVGFGDALRRAGDASLQLACTFRARLVGIHALGAAFAGDLLIAPCHAVHTYGMRGDLDIAFVARDGSVLEVHRDVEPGRILRCRDAAAVVERRSPLERTAPWLEPGAHVALTSHPRSRLHDGRGRSWEADAGRRGAAPCEVAGVVEDEGNGSGGNDA